MKLTYLLRLCVFFGLILSFWAFFDLTVNTFITKTKVVTLVSKKTQSPKKHTKTQEIS